MKDLHNHIEVVNLQAPISVTGDTTIDDIDLAGWESAELVIHVGLDAALAAGSAYWDFVLYDSPDGTTYSVVETQDVLGAGTIVSGIIKTIDTTAKDNEVYHFGYVGGQRYLRLIIDETGALTGIIGVLLIKGNPQDKPVIA